MSAVLTVSQLRVLARALEVSGRGRSRRAGLIEAIRLHRFQWLQRLKRRRASAELYELLVRLIGEIYTIDPDNSADEFAYLIKLVKTNISAARWVFHHPPTIDAVKLGHLHATALEQRVLWQRLYALSVIIEHDSRGCRDLLKDAVLEPSEGIARLAHAQLRLWGIRVASPFPHHLKLTTRWGQRLAIQVPHNLPLEHSLLPLIDAAHNGLAMQSIAVGDILAAIDRANDPVLHACRYAPYNPVYLHIIGSAALAQTPAEQLGQLGQLLARLSNRGSRKSRRELAKVRHNQLLVYRSGLLWLLRSLRARRE